MTDDPRELLATACRVLAHQGLTPDVLGHISLRTGPDEFLVRCRGPHERGLAFTSADDIRVARRGSTSPGDGYAYPNELFIHTAVLAARPDVSVVVHSHPRAVVATTIAGIALEPIVGAFDITASTLAAEGIPTWQRAALINDDDLGAAMATALGDRPVVTLYGHGLVSVGRGEPGAAVAEAVVNAVAVDSLARLTLTVRAAGAVPTPIGPDDQAQLPRLGAGFSFGTMWRHLVAVTEAAAAAPTPS